VVLYEFLAGVVVAAIQLTQQHDLGLKEASAAASPLLSGAGGRN
jgi:hypothetical protein